MSEEEIVKKIASIIERVQPDYTKWKSCYDYADSHGSQHLAEECSRAEELFDEFDEDYPDYEMLCRLSEECPDLYVKAANIANC